MLLRSSTKTVCSLVLAALVVASGWFERTHLAHCHGPHHSARGSEACHHSDTHGQHDDHGESQHGHASHVCHDPVAAEEQSSSVDFGSLSNGHDPSACAICRHLGLTPHPAAVERLPTRHLTTSLVELPSWPAPELRVWKRLPIRGPPVV